MARKAKTARTVAHDDSLRAYFNVIKKASLLSAEEEADLSRRILKGDQEARRILVEANLRLVVRIAKRFSTPDVPLLDIIQEGNLGLITAAAKFDHCRQVRFSTYASWWIKQAISRSLSNKRRPIRLPHRKEDALRRIQKSYTSLSQLLMRKPSLEEISTEIGMKREDVLDIMTISNSVVSLDSEIGVDSGTLHDVYEDYSYSPDLECMNKSFRDDTMKSISTLPDRERKIILYRFAFHDGKKHTLKRISTELGISPETVRQIELRAIRKLKEQAGALREYVCN